MKKPVLSIIVLNYNTKDVTLNCLNSINKVKNELPCEVIVSDNSSTDGSVEAIKKNFKWVKIVEGPNISYSNGNNRARKIVTGEYILFLNSDTLVHKNTLKKTVEYMERHKDVGALTCKLVLKDGTLDKDARRRFPTPWVSFKRLFLNDGHEYWYLDKSPDVIHEVDALQGAFFLSRKDLIDKVGWWDEKFIFDGEDLDLSYKIRKLGLKIIYYPEVYITHLKKVTKNKVNEINQIPKMEGINSMEYFYRKNLWSNYSLLFNYFVIVGINLLKVIRFLQIKLKR